VRVGNPTVERSNSPKNTVDGRVERLNHTKLTAVATDVNRERCRISSQIGQKHGQAAEFQQASRRRTDFSPGEILSIYFEQKNLKFFENTAPDEFSTDTRTHREPNIELQDFESTLAR
jgi:hypothetical protein